MTYFIFNTAEILFYLPRKNEDVYCIPEIFRPINPQLNRAMNTVTNQQACGEQALGEQACGEEALGEEVFGLVSAAADEFHLVRGRVIETMEEFVMIELSGDSERRKIVPHSQVFVNRAAVGLQIGESLEEIVDVLTQSVRVAENVG